MFIIIIIIIIIIIFYFKAGWQKFQVSIEILLGNVWS